MSTRIRSKPLAAICGLLAFYSTLPPAAAAPATVSNASATLQSLESDLQKSYLELFELSPDLHFTPAQIQEARRRLREGRENCVERYKKEAEQDKLQKQKAEQDLKKPGLTEEARHRLHCEIQGAREAEAQTRVLTAHAIPIAYDNREAKLELLEKWPKDLQEIQAAKEDGSYRNRQWGDVKDIGFREIAKGQDDDIKTGQEAIKQMKEMGLMPPELQDKAVTDYVTGLAQRVASHSDLKVPLHVAVLDAKEANAFALPGGFLFVERGLLEAVDDEAELAGVIGHEIAHDVARHGHKLMRRGEIASIFFQAAEIAASILTGGTAGIGTYYALQYGFYGLGLALNLELLGVSRDYELQADRLGIQYAWNSGYDPKGFIRFFDKMASKEGYVKGLGWFYDHPPFYDRMVSAEREIAYLPVQSEPVETSSRFDQMKKDLQKVVEKATKEEKEAPTLLAREPGCTPVRKVDPNQQIDLLCSVAEAGEEDSNTARLFQ
ncbi:MAG: M48 family metalloprotease [Acidobacteriota bacterium]